MSSNDAEKRSTAGATSRQRSSLACDECRRRKLRCDGQQPQCGICRDTGIPCEVTHRGARGPKKGHLKALKNRVVHLEAILESRMPEQQLQRDLQSSQHSSDPTIPASPGLLANPRTHGTDGWPQETTYFSQSGHATLVDGATSDLVSSSPEWSIPSASESLKTQFPLSDLLHDEL